MITNISLINKSVFLIIHRNVLLLYKTMYFLLYTFMYNNNIYLNILCVIVFLHIQ